MVSNVCLCCFLLLVLVSKHRCNAECKEKVKPAFFVTLKDYQNLYTNTVVKFTRVKTNTGYGYRSRTGIFVAPMAGLYEFNASFMTYSGISLELNLIKNDEFIVRGHAPSTRASTGTLNVILRLQICDEVYLRHPRDFGSIYGDDYSMFSGHML
ncbi:Hypothetical predicted protein [Mytilus galloprovincialis]|uniref:C1q domain-containing protein n=1 Tax=Mytilus galloprovincialis TaxID=29158 RepID=A0A8B6DXB1_MYTGA|nr:Hypothetical predicted protein [Mytilus galloprovincialis]